MVSLAGLVQCMQGFARLSVPSKARRTHTRLVHERGRFSVHVGDCNRYHDRNVMSRKRARDGDVHVQG